MGVRCRLIVLWQSVVISKFLFAVVPNPIDLLGIFAEAIGCKFVQCVAGISVGYPVGKPATDRCGCCDSRPAAACRNVDSVQLWDRTNDESPIHRTADHFLVDIGRLLVFREWE